MDISLITGIYDEYESPLSTPVTNQSLSEKKVKGKEKEKIQNENVIELSSDEDDTELFVKQKDPVWFSVIDRADSNSQAEAKEANKAFVMQWDDHIDTNYPLLDNQGMAIEESTCDVPDEQENNINIVEELEDVSYEPEKCLLFDEDEQDSMDISGHYDVYQKESLSLQHSNAQKAANNPTSYHICPLAVIFIGERGRHDCDCWTLIKERLYACYMAQRSLLLILELDNINCTSAIDEEAREWLAKFHSHWILVVINQALDSKKKPYDVSKLPLVINDSSTTGILVLEPYSYEQLLNSYEDVLTGGYVRWIVGFSNPSVHARNFFSFIPEFVVQACLAYQYGKKKTILNAIVDSLLIPPLSSLTGIILIFQGKFRTFPSIFHISTETSAKPWGLTLSNCPTCQTNRYLEGNGQLKSLSCHIYCQGCNGKGVINRPAGWALFQTFLGQKGDKFWIGTLPEPGPLTINWERNFTIHQISVQKHVEHIPGITAVCSSCRVGSLCRKCSGTGCDFALCVGWRGCLTESNKEETSWLCPMHALLTEDKPLNGILNCNISMLQKAISLFPIIIFDLTKTSAMSRIADMLKKGYFSTECNNLVTIVCPHKEADKIIARTWMKLKRDSQYFAIAIVEGELESQMQAFEQIKELAESNYGKLPLSAVHVAVDLAAENWQLQSQLVQSGTLQQITTLYTTAYGSCSAKEVCGQLICELLLQPLAFHSHTTMDIWKRPMIFHGLTAMRTIIQSYHLKRVALVQSAGDMHLDFIPNLCWNCKEIFNQEFDSSGVILSCVFCGDEKIRIEIQTLGS